MCRPSWTSGNMLGCVQGLGTQPTPPMVNLDLHEVQLAGYGPFRYGSQMTHQARSLFMRRSEHGSI